MDGLNPYSDLHLFEGEKPKKKRECNLHYDCDAADAKADAEGKRRASHCRADDCEDCFGC
jgi:hypothetical protein